MISLNGRRPAVTRPVAEPTPAERHIASLEQKNAYLKAVCASKETTIGALDRRVVELQGTLAEERKAHQIAMSSRVKVDELPDDDLRREHAQQQRNLITLSNQLAEARTSGDKPVRFGGWKR